MESSDRKEYVPAKREHLRQEFFATKPTGFTRFLRVFLPYQLWRFAVINVKMVRIISKGH
jgi:hypothetical protein